MAPTCADIFQAIEQNDLDTVKYLVEKKKVSLTITDYKMSQTPAHAAVRKGNLNILKYVLEKDPSILDIGDFYGNIVFFLAIENGNLDMVKYLVEEQNTDISKPNEACFRNTAIHRAAEFGQLEILKYFVERKKGDVNVMNRFNQSPVFLAAENKYHHVIKYLVDELNANVTTIDHNKQNILYVTVQRDDLNLMKYFLDEKMVKFDINWKDKFGNTLVHQACESNRLKILTYLVTEKVADVNIADQWNQTPLHSAARAGHYAICKFLVQNGANTELKNDIKLTPAQETRDDRIKKLIENLNKRPRRNVSYYTKEEVPLHWRMLYIKGLELAGQIEGDMSNRQADIASIQFQHFLTIAETIVRNSNSSKYQRVKHQSLLTPREIMESRMDPLAVDAVQTGPIH